MSILRHLKNFFTGPGSAALLSASAFGRIPELRSWPHLLKPQDRRIIKFTGVGNIENETLYYPSFYHFVRNVPSILRPGRHDYLVSQNFLHEEFIASEKPKVFFTREPLAYMTPETRKNIKKKELKPYLYLYDEPDVKQRMYYVALRDDRSRVVRLRQKRLQEKRPGFCCIINRYVEHDELNLWGQRIRFVRAMGSEIDIYGDAPWYGRNKWVDYDNYLGPAVNKIKTLSRYTFALTFENTDYPGYITEKLFHALCAGAIPLYWGGGALMESIPAESYIDCRDQDPQTIYRFIKAMPHETIVEYRKAAIEFLGSSFADRFTWKYWAQAVIERLKAQER
jgi:Glycosyltransferase family 10 (fucosyltransferase) C-term